MLLKIDLAQKPAVLLHETVDLARDLAFVERIAAFLADQSQSCREARILEDVAFRRCAPFAIECVRLHKCTGEPFINARTERPVVRDQLGDRETLFGITNCRGEIVTQFQFSEFLVQFSPGIYRSRHGDRQHAGRRNGLAMQLCQLRFHLIVTQTQWRTSAPVDSIKFVFLRAVNDCEQIAANAVGDWFHQTERCVRGDRRIHSAAATLQNVEADLRGSRHASANHSMSRQDF